MKCSKSVSIPFLVLFCPLFHDMIRYLYITYADKEIKKLVIEFLTPKYKLCLLITSSKALPTVIQTHLAILQFHKRWCKSSFTSQISQFSFLSEDHFETSAPVGSILCITLQLNSFILVSVIEIILFLHIFLICWLVKGDPVMRSRFLKLHLSLFNFTALA